MSINTLILGIGNTLLSDEGVGIHVLDALLSARQWPEHVTLLDGGTLSFTLAGAIEDAQGLVVIDAARMALPPGSVRSMEGPEMDTYLRGNRKGVHEVSLADLLDIARLTEALPQRRCLVGIEPACLDWGERPGAQVAAAIPQAAVLVCQVLARWGVVPSSGNADLDQ